MHIRKWVPAVGVAVLALTASLATAQQDDLQLTLPEQFGAGQGFGLGGSNSDDPLQLDGAYVVERGGTRGRLSIKANIDDNWHIYSLTQPAEGPVKSKLTVADSPDFKMTGDFTPSKDPHVKPPDVFPVPSEEFSGEVVFTAPFDITAGVDPASLNFEVTYTGQACEDQEDGFGKCLPLGPTKVTVEYNGLYEAPTGGPYQDKKAHAELVGVVSPSVVKPGETVRLTITATPEPPYHVYSLGDAPNNEISHTLIALTKSNNWQVSRAEASASPVTDPKNAAATYHEEPVSWTVEITVPEDAEAGSYDLAGIIGFQTCTPKRCDPPTGATFIATVEVGAATQASSANLSFTSSNYKEAKQARALAAKSEPRTVEPINLATLIPIIGYSLLGGLILNLMPCVLPVIGLKVMSFAQQGGENRSRVFALNLWYAIGLISVFLVLATLAAFLNFGWGELFTLTWFKVAMITLVFAMALSFLGVWEIPIPGFSGSGHASKLQQQEGLSGAFFKGVFTTILATPCSGPFLGPVFGYTLTQPAIVTYIIFGCIGLGMSLPYLIIGMVPSLVKLLPKPGAWMDTFKQVMAFILLGTVVYLFTTIKVDYFIATLALLVAIWFSCWLIGRTPITASATKKAASWIAGIAVAGVIGFMAFEYLTPHEKILPWEPYTEAALVQARAEGKTVMIDFTADWCPTCQVNSKRAIETQAVLSVVNDNDVVTLLADWTDYSPAIKEKLNELGTNSIPMLAIYPAGAPEPIVLPDLVSKSDVISALEEAGPSSPADVAASDSSPAAQVAANE